MRYLLILSVLLSSCSLFRNDPGLAGTWISDPGVKPFDGECCTIVVTVDDDLSGFGHVVVPDASLDGVTSYDVDVSGQMLDGKIRFSFDSPQGRVTVDAIVLDLDRGRMSVTSFDGFGKTGGGYSLWRSRR